MFTGVPLFEPAYDVIPSYGPVFVHSEHRTPGSPFSTSNCHDPKSKAKHKLVRPD